MNTTRRVAVNLLANYASQISVKLLAFVWLIAVAHRLGVADYGRLVTAISITAVIGVLMDFGMSGLVTREVARDRSRAAYYLLHASLAKIGLSVVFAGLTWLATTLLGYSRETSGIIHILVLFVILQNMAAIPRTIYFAYERISFPSLFGFLAKVASVLTGLFFLTRGLGLVWIAASMVLEGLVELVLGLSFIGRIWRDVPQTAVKESRSRLLRRAFPFALVSVMVVLHFSLDTILLSRLKDEVVVAWYNASFRLVAALLFLPEAFANTLYPLLCRKHADSRAFAKWLDPSFRSVLLAGLGISTVFLFSPGWVIGVLYPPDFKPAAPALRILGMAVALVFVNAVLGTALNAMNRESARFRVTLAGVVVNVWLNLILIPRYAHVGAAAATLATQLAVTLSYMGMLRRDGALRTKSAFFLRAGAAMAVSGGASLAAIRICDGAAVVVGPVVFAAACILDGALEREDYKLAGRLFREWLRYGPGESLDQEERSTSS